jgi:hypothetical protein
VIPVLVDGASMPSAEQLPEPLQNLSRRQAVRLTHERFSGDADSLVIALEGVVQPRAKVSFWGGSFGSPTASYGHSASIAAATHLRQPGGESFWQKRDLGVYLCSVRQWPSEH